jgi:hypothetical protein
VRVTLLLLVASALTFAAFAGAAAREPGIRLADGVGPLHVGMSRATLEQELGRGRIASDWFGRVVRYPRQHVHVSYLGRSVFRAGTTWRGYRTPAGIGPGSTVAALRRAYPRATCERAARPFDRSCLVPARNELAGGGYTIFYARNGVVREVDVWLLVGG